VVLELVEEERAGGDDFVFHGATLRDWMLTRVVIRVVIGARCYGYPGSEAPRQP
jgi:hypothetical protein